MKHRASKSRVKQITRWHFFASVVCWSLVGVVFFIVLTDGIAR